MKEGIIKGPKGRGGRRHTTVNAETQRNAEWRREAGAKRDGRLKNL